MKHRLEDVAAKIGAVLDGQKDIEIDSVETIEKARPGSITFLANIKYAKFVHTTQASAVIVPNDFETVQGKSVLRCENPYFAFMKTVRLFHPEKRLVEQGIHPAAIIHKTAKTGSNASIGAHVYVGKNTVIGNNVQLFPNCVIGEDVQIGDDVIIHANASIREGVRIGNRCVIYDGAVIGSDGFGFAPARGKYHKIPQVGTVVIGDDVEIGSNVTIDRATLGETRIENGVKLDNLIQVAHNCVIGENTVIAAQAGLSGSTRIGRGVRIGGQAGFAGHLAVEDHCAIMAQSGITKDLPAGSVVIGSPAMPHREAFRMYAASKRLPEFMQEIKELKMKIDQLEKEKNGSC